MPDLPRVNPGDPLVAEQYNVLADAVERTQTALGGATGIDAVPAPGSSAPGQVLWALQNRLGWVLRARITKAPPAGVAVLPSACRYDAASLDSAHTLTNELPSYGRQVENDECAIYPARVDDLCLILISPQDNRDQKLELMLLRENPARGSCP